MLFYLALTIMVLYTIFFFYVDIRNYLNKGGSFGEGMINMQVPTNVNELQQKGPVELEKLLDKRPNLKQAYELGKPDFMKGITSAMPHLLSAYTKSKPDLDQAQPHLESAYSKAKGDITKAQPHLMSAYNKAQPDLKNALDNSFNDFNEAYQKSKPHIGAEMVEVGSGISQMGKQMGGQYQQVSNNMPGVNSDVPGASEDVMAPNKNNQIPQASQSSATPSEMQNFSVNMLPNGLISKTGKGRCANGCLAPQYDSDRCSNEIFKGKAYRNCPWVSDGSIDDTACKDCGSILIPKNKYGYARTRPGLFNEKSLRVALEACKLDKASDNLDYIQIGKDFMEDLSRIKRFREPRFKESEYRELGRIVYKYDMDKMNASLYKSDLTRVLNGLLDSSMMMPVNDRDAKYRRRRKCGQSDKTSAKVEQLKSMMGDLKYQASIDSSIGEMKSDNRLGGSKSAYSKNYKPMDPNKFPRPYDAIWSGY